MTLKINSTQHLTTGNRKLITDVLAIANVQPGQWYSRSKRVRVQVWFVATDGTGFGIIETDAGKQHWVVTKTGEGPVPHYNAFMQAAMAYEDACSALSTAIAIRAFDGSVVDDADVEDELTVAETAKTALEKFRPEGS